MAVTTTTTKIVNYRIEKVSNGYILHRTYGKDESPDKMIFLSKDDMLRYLESEL